MNTTGYMVRELMAGLDSRRTTSVGNCALFLMQYAQGAALQRNPNLLRFREITEEELPQKINGIEKHRSRTNIPLRFAPCRRWAVGDGRSQRAGVRKLGACGGESTARCGRGILRGLGLLSFRRERRLLPFPSRHQSLAEDDSCHLRRGSLFGLRKVLDGPPHVLVDAEGEVAGELSARRSAHATTITFAHTCNKVIFVLYV